MLQEQVIISRADSSYPWGQLILKKKLAQIMLMNTVQQTDTSQKVRYLYNKCIKG